MKTLLDIGGNFSDRLVDQPTQTSPFIRKRSGMDLRCTGNKWQQFAGQLPEAVKKTETAVNPLIIPVQILLRRRCKE